MTAENLVKIKENIADYRKVIKNGVIPEKEFKARNSVLTDLYEIEHFSSIRHVFVAMIVMALLSNIISELFGSGTVRLGFKYLKIAFGQFDKAVLIWILLFICTSLLHPAFSIWAKSRINFQVKSVWLKLWDCGWLMAFLLYCSFFLLLVPFIKFKFIDLPIASASTILSEQVRMLMKMHAFVRSNAPKVLAYKPHSEKDEPVPVFTKYLYFLFAPTLVYKNSYPRTKQIRWSFVLLNFLEVLGGMIFMSFMIAHYLVPEYRNYGLVPHTWRSITISIFSMIIPGSLIMLVGFYLLLHAWMNAWGEMLRFADRLFYMDWWNASIYSTYYRKWNVVIHDYLHEYVYKDVYEIIVPGNRAVAACAVFLLSAIVHEYILGFMFGFCYPVLGLEFICCGGTVYFLQTKQRRFLGNTFLWWSLALGAGIQASLYSMELYARINCPKENTTISDYFVPRSWSCYQQS